MVVGHERSGVTGHVEPGVVVKLEAREVLGAKRRRPEHRLRDGIEHESAQFLYAGLRPAKQVEAALEHLVLWDVARHGIAVLVALAREKERLELAVQPLARGEPRLAERHREYRTQRDRWAHHGGIQACSEATRSEERRVGKECRSRGGAGW